MQCTCKESINDLMIQTYQHMSQKGVLDRYWANVIKNTSNVVVSYHFQISHYTRMNHVIRSSVDGVQTGLVLLNLV